MDEIVRRNTDITLEVPASLFYRLIAVSHGYTPWEKAKVINEAKELLYSSDFEVWHEPLF